MRSDLLRRLGEGLAVLVGAALCLTMIAVVIAWLWWLGWAAPVLVLGLLAVGALGGSSGSARQAERLAEHPGGWTHDPGAG